ncbi:MAG: FHA domain-containing protein, partial [Chloroflexota bacterium]
DLPFPTDSPVSRHHAQVEERNGGLWISEVESVDPAGNPKRPTYGTYVNDAPIGTAPVLLKSRDEVRLGKRVRLRFEPGKKLLSGEARTLDQFNISDSEPTQEA